MKLFWVVTGGMAHVVRAADEAEVRRVCYCGENARVVEISLDGPAEIVHEFS